MLLPLAINSMIYDLSKSFLGTHKIELCTLQRVHSTPRTMTAESSSSPNSVPFIRIRILYCTRRARRGAVINGPGAAQSEFVEKLEPVL